MPPGPLISGVEPSNTMEEILMKEVASLFYYVVFDLWVIEGFRKGYAVTWPNNKLNDMIIANARGK